MKRAFVFMLLFALTSFSAYSLHEVEFKNGNYFYGIIKEVSNSKIIFRSVDLQQEYEVNKIDIANMKEIPARVYMLNGENIIGSLAYDGNDYFIEGDFVERTIPQNEVTFIEYHDRNEKEKKVNESSLNDLINPDAKLFYNRIGAGIGWPAVLNINFSRTMNIHEVGFVFGLSDPDRLYLTFEFDYAYLFENTRSVSHGVFGGLGYKLDRATVYTNNFTSGITVENEYFYLGAGYKLNLYFINMKLGYAIPISQSYDINIPELQWDVNHIPLFQLGFNFRF